MFVGLCPPHELVWYIYHKRISEMVVMNQPSQLSWSPLLIESGCSLHTEWWSTSPLRCLHSSDNQTQPNIISSDFL